MTALHLAVALEGTGWHPASWRDLLARPDELLSARYWTDLAVEAERGLLDFVTLEDAFALQPSRSEGPGDRTDQVRGRLDAVLVAARIAAATSHLGLVPMAGTAHTEPFHVAVGIASLDHATRGRAGWRPQVSGRRSDAGHFGRREFPEFTRAFSEAPEGRELFDEANGAVEVVRRLWDGWEDDAEIRDAATGRGPSITPRPPQGQPLVTALAHDVLPYEFAARSADVVYITPHSRQETAEVIAQVRDAESRVGRTGAPLKVFADLVVFLGPDAKGRKQILDELDGAELASDAEIFVGEPRHLADLLLDRHSTGLDGFRLRPGTLPRDLKAITRSLVPELQSRGAFRDRYAETALRARLGLPRPAGRYATAS